MKQLLSSIFFICILGQVKSQCPVLNGAMVNACNAVANTEGINEFVIFTTSVTANVSTYDVNYGTANPPVSNKLSGQNATTKTGTGVISAGGGCTINFVTSPTTSIPANSKVIFIPAATDNNYDITGPCAGGSIYVVYIATGTAPSSWANAGTLANTPAAPGRYLQVTNSTTAGCNAAGAVVVNYTNSWSSNVDGNFVSWNSSGVASYFNNGCNAFTLAQKNITLLGKLINDKVNLNWTNLNEAQVKNYIIEKSCNGNYFNEIGELLNNNSGNYYFEDNTKNESIIYYRIKVIANDGSYYYSDITSVKINSVALNINSIYPTNATNKITLNLSNKKASNATLQIIASNAKLVMNKNIIFKNGINQTVIDVSSLATGIYYIRLVSNNEVASEKFIKK